MNKKMILPLLAFLFALASAFAYKPVQIAYFKGPSGVQTGQIEQTDKDCQLNRLHQCTIEGSNAYDTEAHAMNAPSSVGLLKYN